MITEQQEGGFYTTHDDLLSLCRVLMEFGLTINDFSCHILSNVPIDNILVFFRNIRPYPMANYCKCYLCRNIMLTMSFSSEKLQDNIFIFEDFIAPNKFSYV